MSAVLRRSLRRASQKLFGSDDAEDLVRLSGISVRFLDQLVADAGNDCRSWTLQDVCESVVLDKTQHDKRIYVDTINPDDIGPLYQGIFVCVARSASFRDLVETLVATCEECGQETHQQFVWLEVFCVNQPLLIEKSARELKSAALEQVYNAATEFEQQMVFVGSWTKLQLLSESWCLWEIHACVKSGKPVEVLSRMKDEEIFIQALLVDSDVIAQSISRAKIENATDRFDAAAVMETTIGTSAFEIEHAAKDLMSPWLYKYMLQALDARRTMPGPRSEMSLALVLFAFGSFLHEHLFCHDEALQMLNESVRLFQSFGAEQAAINTALDKVAHILNYKGEYGAALEIFEEVLRVEKSPGKEQSNAIVANTLESIATVMTNKGDYDTALKRLEESFHIKERLMASAGDQAPLTFEHGPRIAKTMRLIARVLQLKGEYGLAHEKFEQAVQLCTSSFQQNGGRKHPSAVEGLLGMASCQSQMGDFENALNLLDEARASGACVKELEAKEHCARGVALRIKGDTAQSITELERCLELRHRMRQNASHAGVSEAQFELGTAFIYSGDWAFGKAVLNKELAERIQRFPSKDHPRIREVENLLH